MQKLRNVIFLLSVTVVLLLTYSVSHAQTDSTSVISPGVRDLLNLIPAKVWKWLGIAGGLYEVVVLFIPTIKNYSIIGKIFHWFAKGGNRWK